jgi:hypothetical protein
MGSWSEACGFSGMEIGEGDVAYCCLISDNPRGSLNDGSFRHFAPTTTLVRGTYNDYGYLHIEEDEALLALFNQQAQLELKNGDDFSLDHLNGRTEDRWWIHGRAFDFMPTITPEFPYSYDREDNKCVKIANIGEAADRHIQTIRDYVVQARKDMDEIKKMDDPERRAIMTEIKIFGMNLSNVLGYGNKPGLNREAFTNAVKNGDDIEPYLTSYRRVFILGYALGELRRNLARNESIGPQWGGHVALRQFGNFLVEVTNGTEA